MKTKTLFSVALAAAVLQTASCNKSPVPGTGAGEDRLCTVGVGLDGIVLTNPTKAASTTPLESESHVNDAYILVFDGDGKLETYKGWTGGNVLFSLNAGDRTFVGIVNAGESITAVATLAEFNAKVSSLSELETKGFVMTGSKDISVSGSTEFIITVKRLAAKVVVGKITADFDNPSLRTQTTVLKGVYLINVCSDASYDGVHAGSWINKMDFTTSACDDFVAKRDLGITLTQGEEKTLDYVFYMMPNATEADAHEGDWSARKTRVVFEVAVGNQTWYYSKTFPSVVSNGLYSLNSIKLTKYGAKTADAAMDNSGASGSIHIDDWTLSGDYDEEL